MVSLEVLSVACDEYDRTIKARYNDLELCVLKMEYEEFVEKRTSFLENQKGQTITGTVSIEYVTKYKKVNRELSFSQPIADSPHIVAIVEVKEIVDECVVIAENSITNDYIRIEFENDNLPAVGDAIEIEGCLVFYDQEIKLTTDGPGIVIYSDANMSYVSEGEDFFSKEFQNPDNVAEHIRKGDIIGFNTGSSGTYNITARTGYPSEKVLEEYPIAIRLALDVKGGSVSVIDLFWLTEWSSEIPDEQKIFMYFNRIEEMPQLTWRGVPILLPD